MNPLTYLRKPICHLAVNLLLLIVSILVPAASPIAAEAKQIVIYGASGMIGSRIVDEALARGHFVKGIVRNPATITRTHEHLEIKEGDITDVDSVVREAQGVAAIISAIGGKQAGVPEESIEYLAARSLGKAMQRIGIGAPRIILVGGASTSETSPGVTMLDEMEIPPPPLGAMLVGHKLALDYLRTLTDVKWTVFTPALRISPGTRTGKYRLGGDSLVRDVDGQSRISAEDFAAAIIDELENSRNLNRRSTTGY